MEIKKAFGRIYDGRKVLITGHTGFKGSWLSLWLCRLGASVTGYALPPSTDPNHFNLLRLDIDSVLADIRDRENLNSIIKRLDPDIVFHLAAQPIVRYAYRHPLETLETNIIGTANVLEACRSSDNLKAAVIVTSDKCYENHEVSRGYVETDPMGGYDPYSASKGCAELVTNSYRNSFFNLDDYGIKHNKLIATVRAGNVIGGGDWAEDRLIPDIMRAAVTNETALIRNPDSTRPWQHVLESLSGYLVLGQRLMEGGKEFAEAWNFGPDDASNSGVGNVIKTAKDEWEKVKYQVQSDNDNPHETGFLKLDSSKARLRLKWKPVWDFGKTLKMTVGWYKEYYSSGNIKSSEDLSSYIEEAMSQGLAWAL